MFRCNCSGMPKSPALISKHLFISTMTVQSRKADGATSTGTLPVITPMNHCSCRPNMR